MRVLVTGSSGFIGSHLVELLVREGYDVHGLDRRRPAAQPVEWIHHACDILDRSQLSAVFDHVRPQWVVHLAARIDLHETRSLNGYAANIGGVENLLAAIAATPSVQRAICTSSQLVCRVGYMPAHDEDYGPNTLYGQSKVETERLWRSADGGGVEWCLVRPTTVWGPRMNPHYVRFLQMVRDGRYFHVGGGVTMKSYGFVGNVVYQYHQLLRADAALIHRRTFYLADAEPTVLREWVEAFRRELAGPPIRTVPRVAARAAAYIGDALNVVGFRRYPFNSFRLSNVLTASPVDVTATTRICGPLPFSSTEGVAATARWLRELWAGGPDED